MAYYDAQYWYFYDVWRRLENGSWSRVRAEGPTRQSYHLGHAPTEANQAHLTVNGWGGVSRGFRWTDAGTPQARWVLEKQFTVQPNPIAQPKPPPASTWGDTGALGPQWAQGQARESDPMGLALVAVPALVAAAIFWHVTR